MSAPVEVTYPSELPITARRSELLETIAAHQVVIVAGETGSGKSTQLPKMCIELGLHEHGWIGHTQPRRIAARSIAERVAEELDDRVGGLVGYKVRFTDKVSSDTAIKAMTDGILLAEMQHDRALSKYSVLIIDEAHERSLNIDFLLGYVKQLLPRRPDLKVIVTSATIDTERFSQHFDDAPIVEVSGRTYPVEIRYRPLVDEETGEPIGQVDGIVDAVHELERHGDGDVLVFCSGEREIRDAVDALSDARLQRTEIVPLFGRLSAAEQHRVFDTPDRRRVDRRIVVATNVAETSLTVPGIRYVVDPGTARISRYSNRTKVQRLPIEAVSRASADQRAGRCGRLGPGLCIRLYSEEDFASRPEFTEPEITRTNLASVILQMASLRLGDVEQFPFVDPPEFRNIRDGIALLEELDAVDPQRVGTRKWLTPIGRRLARLPVDPRFGRMVIAAAESACLREVIVITAAMSIQDPRERPQDKREQAGQLHARFDEPGSDFLAWRNLWDHLEGERRTLSRNQFRKMCRREFLNHNRVREWQDIVRQLERTAKDFDWTINSEPASAEVVHRALLTGLLSHIGVKDPTGNEYLGGRGARFVIGRSSTLSKRPPGWVMAGELVETNRLWAHSAARIQPEWAERASAHLVKISHDDPQWDRERGSAMTVERVSLYGVPLVAGRRVHHRRVDPAEARELFIHHALIEGDWDTEHDFFAQNEGVLDEVRRLGARRRRDLSVEYDVLYDFYDARVPDEVTSGADFDRWWNRERHSSPELLDLDVSELVGEEAALGDDDAFPEMWHLGDVDLALDYNFETGAEDDGVTIVIPIALLPHLPRDAFEWNVPGLRKELVTALLRTMPKAARKAFVPIPDTVDAIMPALAAASGGVVESVREQLRTLSGEALPADALDLARVPVHLRPLLRVVDDDGTILAQHRDLDELRAGLDDAVRRELEGGDHALTSTGQTSWTFGAIPRTLQLPVAGQQVDSYPALADEGATVGLALLPDAASQHESMWRGTRRLLRLNVAGSARLLDRLLDRTATLAIASSPHGSKVAWVNDAADCIYSRLLDRAGGPVWGEDDWDRLVDRVRELLAETVSELGPIAVEILVANSTLRAALSGPAAEPVRPARADMLAHLDRLVYPGHLDGVGPDRLADVARYLRAISLRLEKLPERVADDARRMARVRSVEAEFERYAERLEPSPALEDLNWMLEEFRVATFAEQVGVAQRVSEKRIRSLLRQL